MNGNGIGYAVGFWGVIGGAVVAVGVAAYWLTYITLEMVR